MHVSFLEHEIELRTWHNKQEMVNFIATSEAGYLLLGENPDQESEFYSVTIYLSQTTSRFGVGICSLGIGLVPVLLPQPENSMLLLGFNSEVLWIHIPDGKLAVRLELETVFHSFLPVHARGMILVKHEIGIVAIEPRGKVLWKFSRDVITKAHVEGGRLHLQFMDSPPVVLNLSDGSLTQ